MISLFAALALSTADIRQALDLTDLAKFRAEVGDTKYQPDLYRGDPCRVASLAKEARQNLYFRMNKTKALNLTTPELRQKNGGAALYPLNATELGILRRVDQEVGSEAAMYGCKMR